MSTTAALAGRMAGIKRERDADEAPDGTAEDRPSGMSTSHGMMQNTDSVLEAQLDKLRGKRGAVKVPRWAYAKLAQSLRDKATFLHALRAFHNQTGGEGASIVSNVADDTLYKSQGMPPVSLHELFQAVAAAGGATYLRAGDEDWRRLAFVPKVLAASRAALADVSGLPAYVRRIWMTVLAGFELVYSQRIAAAGRSAGINDGNRAAMGSVSTGDVSASETAVPVVAKEPAAAGDAPS